MKKILHLVNKEGALLFLLLLCGGILSCGLKYDLFWDFVNYHYFNPWAFLNDRINYDVGAAGMNAFFNPLPDIPLYLLIKYFNDYPNFICFVQGMWFGALLFLFFKIVCQVVDTSTRVGRLQVFVILLVGATGWSTFMQIGTSTNEIQISVFIMAGLYVLLKEMYSLKQNKWLFLLSGLLLGMAMGLKLTAVTYCVSSALAVFLYYRRLERPLEKIFFFAVGGISGFLIFNGFWMYILWEHFQNPFFPPRFSCVSKKRTDFPFRVACNGSPTVLKKILTNTERKKLTSAHSPAPECHHCEYPENFRHVQNASNPPRQHGKKPAAVIRKKKPAPRRSDILYFPNFPFDLLEHNFSRQAVLSPKIIVLLHLAKCLHI